MRFVRMHLRPCRSDNVVVAESRNSGTRPRALGTKRRRVRRVRRVRRARRVRRGFEREPYGHRRGSSWLVGAPAPPSVAIPGCTPYRCRRAVRLRAVPGCRSPNVAVPSGASALALPSCWFLAAHRRDGAAAEVRPASSMHPMSTTRQVPSLVGACVELVRTRLSVTHEPLGRDDTPLEHVGACRGPIRTRLSVIHEPLGREDPSLVPIDDPQRVSPTFGTERPESGARVS
jgi:hypothetical protein